MDTKGLKKIIKEAVKEALQEEIRDILLEATIISKSTTISAQKNNGMTITENKVAVPAAEEFTEKARSFYSQLMGEFSPGKSEINMTSNHAPQGTYIPGSGNAGIEGTLHPGELGLNQIMGLLTPTK